MRISHLDWPMTNFLSENCDQIKTIVVKTKGTPTQKLLAILIAAGVENTAELVGLTGLAERSVQSAKRNLMRAHPSAEAHPSAPHPDAEAHSNAVSGALECGSERKVSPHTPLQKKTTFNPSVETVAAGTDGRTNDLVECKAAFNGSTEAMLDMVESAMGGHCRKNAAQWLANLTRINGQQAVAHAYQKFLTAKAEGSIIARPLPWFDKTAKTCKAEAPKPTAAPETPWSAITLDMKRNVKPAPGSVRLPEVVGNA